VVVKVKEETEPTAVDRTPDELPPLPPGEGWGEGIKKNLSTLTTMEFTTTLYLSG